MKSLKRGERIAAKLNKAMKMKKENYYGHLKDKPIKEVLKYVDSVPSCSCHMCGNPRRIWNHKTIQELKHEESCEYYEGDESDNI